MCSGKLNRKKKIEENGIYQFPLQTFFDRQCSPPKYTHYIFQNFIDHDWSVDSGEKHFIVKLSADVKVKNLMKYN